MNILREKNIIWWRNHLWIVNIITRSHYRKRINHVTDISMRTCSIEYIFTSLSDSKAKITVLSSIHFCIRAIFIIKSLLNWHFWLFQKKFLDYSKHLLKRIWEYLHNIFIRKRLCINNNSLSSTIWIPRKSHSWPMKNYWHPTRNLHHKFPPWSFLTFFLYFCLSMLESMWHIETIFIKAVYTYYIRQEKYQEDILSTKTYTIKQKHVYKIHIYKFYVENTPTMLQKDIHNTKIIQQLKKIWLNETDASIYLASIHLWACSIQQLTDQTNIHRITTHDSVSRLIQKWLLLETFSWRKRLIYPQQISSLQHLVDRKKAEVDSLQQDVSSTIHMLQSLHLQSEYLPKITISKWRQWIQSLLSELKENSPQEIFSISDSWHFDELLNVQFLDSLAQQKTKLSIILPRWFEHFIFSAHAKGVELSSKTFKEETSRSWWITLRWATIALHAYEWIYITTTKITNPAIAMMMKGMFTNMRENL